MTIFSLSFHIALVSLLAWHSPTGAATISGVVSEDDDPVPRARMVLVNAESKIVLDRVYTDVDGAFNFTVKPGTFNIGASKSEYTTGWVKGIAVQRDDVSIRMELVNEAFAEDQSASANGDCDGAALRR
ncbi:MAG TPA: carboxypeptidase-like regulatory domain-containing protein [Gammaproteobacteria bacterium]